MFKLGPKVVNRVSRTRSSGAGGFTLIELLAVLAVIGVLLALLLPAMSSVVGSVHTAKCLASLRSFGQGLSMYMEAGDGLLPEARWPADFKANREAPFDLLSESLGIGLPVLREDGLFETIEPFACPADKLVAPEVGVSYVYTPYAFFSVLPETNRRRTVTRMFMANAGAAVMTDRLGFHQQRKMAMRSDGSASAFDESRGLEIRDE